MLGVSTGILFLDYFVRPLFKFGMKFPVVGMLVLLVWYGIIAYFVLKSGFFSDSADQRSY